jgi:ribosomal protein L37E
MHAAFMECPRLVKLLIDKGANTTLKDDDGRTVFGMIHARNDARYHHVLVVLTETTADGKAWVKSADGKAWVRTHEVDRSAPVAATPAEVTDILRGAIAADESKEQRQLIEWVESGGDLNWRTPNGWTLLHLAAQVGSERMLRFLVAHGADLDARDTEGETPLMLACEIGYAALRMNPSVVKALLDLGADVNAEDHQGRTALRLVRLLESSKAKEITALLEQHGAEKIPGKTATCPECGAPESVRMRDRAVQVTFNGVFAGFSCPQCQTEEQVPLDAIDKVRGVQVSCPSCGRTAFVPPTVWCDTCGNGLSTGWQSSIVSGAEAIEAGQLEHHPTVKQYRQMARDFVKRYGPLKRVEYLSHFPKFEINFVFDKKTVYSGERRGQYDIHFLSLGYYGEGPRYAREFLAEAGLPMSSDDIEAIKPGALMRIKSGTVVVEYPTSGGEGEPSPSAPAPAGARSNTKRTKEWWQF